MRHVSHPELLVSRPFVDTRGRNPHRPGGIPDGHFHIRVICLYIVPVNDTSCDIHQVFQNIHRHLLAFQIVEQWFHVFRRLCESRFRQPPLGRSFFFLRPPVQLEGPLFQDELVKLEHNFAVFRKLVAIEPFGDVFDDLQP